MSDSLAETLDECNGVSTGGERKGWCAFFFLLLCKFTMGNLKTGTFGMRFEVTGVLTAAEKATLLDAADVAYKGTPALFAASTTLLGVSYQEYQRVAGPPPEFQMSSAELNSTGVPVVGTALGDATAPQLAFVVSFGTNLPGPQHRGRVFTPPPPELQVDGSGQVLDPTARRDWVVDIVEAVEGSVPGTDIDHIVHSLVSGDTEEVITYRGRVKIDTQRRRRSEG